MDRFADFSFGDVIKTRFDQLEEFKKIALSNKSKKRYRLCMHDSPNNRQQEMIICVAKGDYSRPHKHVDVSESHYIIEGAELIVLFDDDGRIMDYFILGKEGGYLCYRINSGLYHMSIPITDTVIKLEVKPGPFVADSNIFPNWAPDGSEICVANVYVDKIKEMIDIDSVYRK